MLVSDKGELIEIDPNGSVYRTRKKIGDALIFHIGEVIVILVIDKTNLNYAALSVVAPNSVQIKRGKRI